MTTTNKTEKIEQVKRLLTELEQEGVRSIILIKADGEPEVKYGYFSVSAEDVVQMVGTAINGLAGKDSQDAMRIASAYYVASAEALIKFAPDKFAQITRIVQDSDD